MLERFLVYLNTEKRASDHTSLAYKKEVQTFLDFVVVESEPELKELTHQSVRGWIVELINNGQSNRTVNRKLSALRTFFKWAQKNNIIEVDPMLKIKGPKQEKRLPEFVKERSEERRVGKECRSR